MSAEDTECGICLDSLDDLTNGKPVNAHYGSADCQKKSMGKPHSYHTECIQTLVATRMGFATCPLCRCKINGEYIQGLNRKFNLFKWLHEKPAVRYMVDFVNNVHYLSGLILVLGMLSLPFYSKPEEKAELIKDIERLYEAVPELKNALVEFASIILMKDMYIYKAVNMMWRRIELLERYLLMRIRENRDIPHKYIEIMKKHPKGMLEKYNRSQIILKHGEYQQNIESEKVVSSFLKGKEDTKRFLDELVRAVTSEHMDHLAESDRGTFKDRIFDKILKNFDKENAEHFAVLLLGKLNDDIPIWMRSTAPNSLAGADQDFSSESVYPLGVKGLENFRNNAQRALPPSYNGPRTIKSPLAAFTLLRAPNGNPRIQGGSKRMKRGRRRRFTYR